ncbi:hypothetical protein [uncultured Marixanthomonas sp.]|uniref:hypothetical protein n=1 Tax=uncultured Marixanthomonas sp. TaxID=757245 RepID=UPI0030D93054|tara:strand:+ start:380 stop:724 length:345 start_codon:yes stop_codon:yes gene_type:complete
MKKFLRLTLFLIILTNVFIACSSGTDFNSEKWKNWKESEAELFLRWDMREDLVNNYDLIGMSTEQIIDLLGEPENWNEKELRYYLGSSRRGINTGSLILQIKNDTITDYEIWHG